MARRTAQPVLLLTDGVDPAGLDVDLAQRTFFRLTADRDRESLTIGPVVVQRDHNFTADLRATFSLSPDQHAGAVGCRGWLTAGVARIALAPAPPAPLTPFALHGPAVRVIVSTARYQATAAAPVPMQGIQDPDEAACHALVDSITEAGVGAGPQVCVCPLISREHFCSSF